MIHVMAYIQKASAATYSTALNDHDNYNSYLQGIAAACMYIIVFYLIW